jgi:hypothetical protein
MDLFRVVAAAALLNVTLAAQAGDVAVGTGIGTPGANVNLIYAFNEKVALRGVANFFSTDFDETQDGIDYELDFDLGSAGAILDWHPAGGSFRFSGGIFANGNDVSGTGQGQSGTVVEFGDMVFPADELGAVNADMELNSTAPYLGIGWGNIAINEGFSFSLDLGVYFQGKPSVTLTTPDVDPSIAAEVAGEIAQAEADLEDEVDFLEFYPYISVGFAYRF